MEMKVNTERLIKVFEELKKVVGHEIDKNKFHHFHHYYDEETKMFYSLNKSGVWEGSIVEKWELHNTLIALQKNIQQFENGECFLDVDITLGDNEEVNILNTPYGMVLTKGIIYNMEIYTKGLTYEVNGVKTHIKHTRPMLITTIASNSMANYSLIKLISGVESINIVPSPVKFKFFKSFTKINDKKEKQIVSFDFHIKMIKTGNINVGGNHESNS